MKESLGSFWDEWEKETELEEKWDKFKWLIVTGLVTLILGYLRL